MTRNSREGGTPANIDAALKTSTEQSAVPLSTNLNASAAAIAPFRFRGRGPAAPDLPEPPPRAINAAELAKEKWIEQLGRMKPGSTDGIRRDVENMRQELEGEEPDLLARLLVLEIVVSWLALQMANLLQAGLAGNATAAVDPLRQRQVDAAQRRWLQATKSLAELQRIRAKRRPPTRRPPPGSANPLQA